MFNFILAIHIIVAISMTGLILIQHGKGADAGASFGAGGAATVFGAAGSASFLTRATAVLTAIFFATSLLLAINAREHANDPYSLDVETSTATTEPTVMESSNNIDSPEAQPAEAIGSSTDETINTNEPNTTSEQ